MLNELLKHNSIIAVAGNRNTAKTSLTLQLLIDLKKKNKKVDIYALGTSRNIEPYLAKNGIKIMRGGRDLYTNIKNAVIFIDEFNDYFTFLSRHAKDTQQLAQFIRRIEHNNNKLILCTADPINYNKMACSLIDVFVVKETDKIGLINGTWLKENIESITNYNQYTLELSHSDYYVISKKELVKKHSFSYNKFLDSKRNNKKLF